MSDPRVPHVIFCDDIRSEMGNKPSLMGCYAGQMILPISLPATLSKLCCLVTLICDALDVPEFIEVSLKLTDGSEALRQRIVPPPYKEDKPDVKKVSYNMMFQLSPCNIHGEGRVEVWVETEQGSVRAGRLNIFSDLTPNQTTTP